MIDSYPAGLFVTSALLFGGHFFRWPKGDLDRLSSYAYGVGAILAGQFVWIIFLPQVVAWDAFPFWLQIASFAVVGGLVTGLGYLYDWVARLWIRSKLDVRGTDDTK